MMHRSRPRWASRGAGLLVLLLVFALAGRLVLEYAAPTPAPGTAGTAKPPLTSARGGGSAAASAPLPSAASTPSTAAGGDPAGGNAEGKARPSLVSPPVTVVLDPGHGGPEPGAYDFDLDLIEKGLNLRVALQLAALLRDEGFRVVLTRDTNRAVSPEYVRWGVKDQEREDLQARIEIANRARADLFVSIHHNGAPGSYKQGVEAWYNPDRTFALRNRRLATLLHEHVLRELGASGFAAVEGGVLEDSEFDNEDSDVGGLYVLGPGTGKRPHEPTLMPGVLGETLYLTHPDDAQALLRPATSPAIARGYLRALVDYVSAFPDTAHWWSKPETLAAERQARRN